MEMAYSQSRFCNPPARRVFRLNGCVSGLADDAVAFPTEREDARLEL